MHYLVTGAAGFVGFHLARRLISSGNTVTGFDAVTDYYDHSLKRHRLEMLGVSDAFTSVKGRLEDYASLAAAAEANPPEMIFHLAAQAGVRHSLDHPRLYLDANLLGTLNVLELARAMQPRHLINGSTSSVYGASDRPSFSETDPTDRPVSLYAATKKGAEVMAHSYAHLFSIPVTTVRFFTVYGPWGRPDMAYYKFTEAIDHGKPIDVYGDGTQQRDLTYVEDLVWAMCGLADRIPEIGRPVGGEGVTDTLSPVAPHRTVNIAAGRPVSLNDFIGAIERALGKKADRRMLPMQPGDVVRTHASPALLKALTGYVPDTTLQEGLEAFVGWYRTYAGR
jgi:UDP-glucuronate 4-epimerase